eukprot:TRINITY_DN4579_c0_g1_i1.p1 TRINITY_DN4579_c0_g1~~TRINITY_DN4579_c0_g1_i1.p1  ORF type:complete len:837 (-),score=163.55 TRINITY_DN4579_c0_g1_i1:123-2633(-)
MWGYMGSAAKLLSVPHKGVSMRSISSLHRSSAIGPKNVGSLLAQRRLFSSSKSIAIICNKLGYVGAASALVASFTYAYNTQDIDLQNKAATILSEFRNMFAKDANCDSPGKAETSYADDIEDDPNIRESKEELLNFKQNAEVLEQENEALRLKFLEMQSSSGRLSSSPRDSVLMYSSLVDKLNSADLDVETKDILPRVVVIGDQSAGKTSVLEMYAEARIFPRGGGEMMTRSPIQVTLTEGVERVAQFTKEDRVYRLNDPRDLQNLRDEIELRMRNSVSADSTVSDSVISLVVRGSKHRVVLVDLPGVIGSTTSGMAPKTKGQIEELCRRYASNPNSVILCIQDGSADAERSNVTDLVKEVDPEGSRTIFVMTKLDQAEKNIPPKRIKDTLEGRLVNLNALGYFAVICGTSNPNSSIPEIKNAERLFFKTSKLFSNNIVKPSQFGMDELARAIDAAFWEQVRQSVYEQLDIINHELIRREMEFERQFGTRILSRQEIFNITRYRILDRIHQIGQIPANHLEKYIQREMWKHISRQFIETVYMRNALEKARPEQFHTAMDVYLSNWSQNGLSAATLEMEKNVIFNLLEHIINVQELFEEENSPARLLFDEVMQKCRNQFKIPQENYGKMAALQSNVLRDDNIDVAAWLRGCLFLGAKMEEYKKEMSSLTKEIFGETQSWYHIWPTITTDQHRNQVLKSVLTEYAQFQDGKPSVLLGADDLAAVKKALTKKLGTPVEDRKIQEIYRHLVAISFIDATISSSAYCLDKHGKYDQQKLSPNTLQCRDALVFSRVHEVVTTTSRAARINIYALRAELEAIVRKVLDSISGKCQILLRKFIS